MKRLIFVLAILLACIPAHAADGRVYKTDNLGRVYYEEFVWSRNYTGWVRHYPKATYYDFDTPTKVAGVAVTSRQQPAHRAGDGPVLNEHDRQAAIHKAESQGAAVDKSLGVNDYRFGEAGGSAAVTAFAFGVAVQLATDPAQAQRIEHLRLEIQALNDALKSQAQTHHDEGEVLSAAIAQRGSALDSVFKSVASLPPLGTGELIPISSNGVLLFATHDPFFALRLSRIVGRIEDGRARLPGVLRETGLAAVRLADVENARGQISTAESFVKIAKTVADFGLGLDPITGTVRGVYELVTGKNIVTGEPLTSFERGLSLINVATIGGFGTIAEATRGVAMLGHMLGGAHLAAVNTAVRDVSKFFRASVIERLLSFRSEGKAVIEEGTVLLNEAKPLINKFPSDGRFARVIPRQVAEELVQGARLSKDDMAFITAAEDLKGIDSRAAIAERLSLYSDPAAVKLKSLDDHVLVEFKFKPADNPLVSTPIDNAQSWGKGWVPGGFTRGGAREWLVDSEAISNGLIDPKTIRIQDIPKP